MRLFKFACKEGESLVYFDHVHVLDLVGRGYHYPSTCALDSAMDCVRGQNRPQNINHVPGIQPCPRDQNIPGSPRPPTAPYMQTTIFTQGEEPGHIRGYALYADVWLNSLTVTS